jgi:hypothetical protein
MAKITLTDVSGGYLSVVTFNANNTLIEQAMENTLSRNGLSPNQMEANLDMNSNYIRNLADGINQQDAVTLSQLQDVVASGGGTVAANVTIVDAGGLYTSNNVEGALQEISTTYATSTLETTNGVTPTDLSYNYGDVRRYGAVADAPEGYYAIEGTVNVWGAGGATGGPSITGTAWTRLEKFTNANSDPIMVLAGTTVSLNGVRWVHQGTGTHRR